MERQAAAQKAHVLVFPYPAQGHINPILQFGKRLVDKGLKVSLVTTIFRSKSMHPRTGAIHVELVSDGCDDRGYGEVKTFEEYLERFRASGTASLLNLLQKLQSSGNKVDCIVYDSLLPWVLDAAKSVGVSGAAFFTMCCAVDVIYCHVRHGRLALPFSGTSVSLPGLPELRLSELPTHVAATDIYPGLLKFMLEQFGNVEEADWIFCNTVDEVEAEAMNWMKTIFPVMGVGTTLPSLYLNKHIREEDDYSLNLEKIADGNICKEWLDSKDEGSVIYVSFGTVVSLGPELIEETSSALKEIPHHFLWVVRESDQSKLPLQFEEETRDKGLVVKWCPQWEVLSHRAVGCFVTHCGWNSTLEGLSLGLPMVAFPQYSDQTTNAKYIEDVWGVGLRVKTDEKGIVRREELKRCIREVMQGERREEIKRSTFKWRELIREALEEGGSSDRNIDEFVAAILCHH